MRERRGQLDQNLNQKEEALEKFDQMIQESENAYNKVKIFFIKLMSNTTKLINTLDDRTNHYKQKFVN